MASGVKVAEETVEAYKAMKLQKTNNRYLIMSIDLAAGLIKVVASKEKMKDVDQEAEYNDFLAQLPSDSGRYCIVDLTIPQKNGAMKDILFLITWCPNEATTKSNILYTTSKRELLNKIREGMIDLQANDLSDLQYCELLVRGCK
ncbi:cofilin [Aplysia californica]|uniref:Cofilin n=1 Tax=Aplysia californica TaxID=6500 RepID=A0ABM0K2L5_APLCA|nr:cofilin [Aplysia californica]